MARVRFTGPEAHSVPMLGRTVQPDEVVDLPGVVLVEQVDGGWLMGQDDADPPDPDADPQAVPGRFVLPAALWSVEDEPKPKGRKPAAKDEG